MPGLNPRHMFFLLIYSKRYVMSLDTYINDLITKSDALCDEVEELTTLVSDLLTYKHDLERSVSEYTDNVNIIFDIYNKIGDLLTFLIEDGQVKNPPTDIRVLKLIAIESYIYLAKNKINNSKLDLPKYKPRPRKNKRNKED